MLPMPKLSQEIVEVIRPYVDFRFSHKTEAERSAIRSKIIKLLKRHPERQETFVQDVSNFMEMNEKARREARRLAEEALESQGLTSSQVNDNQALIAALVQPLGGDMNAVMERILRRVGNSKQHHG